MRGMIQFTFALVVASICQGIWSSPSQATTADEYVAGKIAGRVVEAETGDPLIGATVYIEEISQGAVVAPDGSYAIINVAPGVYTVRASMIGFGTVRQSEVRVSIDRTTRVDFELSVEVIQGEEILITATRPIIEVDRTTSASYMDSESIANLPVQEFSDLLQLQSGLTYDSQGRLHMRGGRSGEVAYLVDGIPVTNQYSGGSKIEIENNWIQELQVISGVFNAEYGQAQSGVINIVTKTGSIDRYSGDVGLYGGSYLTPNTEVFVGEDSPSLDEYNLQGSLQGPIRFLREGSFFSNIRYTDNAGWLNGEQRFLISDTVPIQSYIQEAQQTASDIDNLVGIPIPDSLLSGDRSLVSMNPRQRLSLHGRLSFSLSSMLTASYAAFYSDEERMSYQDYRRYAPEGLPMTTERGINHLLSFTLTPDARSYLRLGISYQDNQVRSRLFKDPLDSRYQGTPFSSNGFAFGGTSNGRSEASNSTFLVKLQAERQVNRSNLVKAGIEWQRHRVEEASQATISDGPVYLDPSQRIPAGNTAGNDQYTREPWEVVLFVQDKLEIDELVLNAGVRFDLWEPNAPVPDDFQAVTNPEDGIRLATGFVDAKRSMQLSPRVGLAFPISSRGVLHVSYGRFFQVPRFSYIYTNSEFEVQLGDLETIMGNADLKPERTTAYELGLQYALTSSWKVEATIYYKDIKNLLGQEIITTVDKKVYARYINRDYGNTRGFAFSLLRQFADQFGLTIDYTYQVARGNASDPNAVFFNNQTRPPMEPEKQVIPLNWDQRHSLNGSVIMGDPSGFTLSIIGRFSTGQPYTPSNPGSQLTSQLANSESKPVRMNLDINLSKRIQIAGLETRLYAKGFNVLDRLNAKSVYSSTGNAFHPYRTLGEAEVLAQNPNFTVGEVDLRPDFFDPPRRIIFGLDIRF
jgi:outer membrane receptor protein involved in Fe transport